MNPQQQTFVNEMLRHGDKQKAYRTAYPKAKSGKAVESAVNRLLKQEEIKAAIEGPVQRIRAEVEAELRQRMQAELVDLYETQKILSSIIRGQYTTQRQVRVKGGFETIDVTPTAGQVLTALNTWYRLNGYITTAKSQQNTTHPPRHAATPQPPGEDPAERWKQTEAELTKKFPARGAEGAPHPFGDIYPPHYPGPYYDPGDPNTREQLQSISTQTAAPAAEPAPPPAEITPGKHNTAPAGGGKAPQPAATPAQAGQSTAPAAPEPPPGESPNTVAAAHTAHSPMVRKLLLRDELKKQGWLPLEEAQNLVTETYLADQHSGTYKMLKQFEKARSTRHYPPAQRAPIEQETGWVRHPQYADMLKRSRPLEWQPAPRHNRFPL